MDERTDGRTDRPTDRPTERERERERYTRLGISPTFRQNAHYPVFVLIMIVIIPPRLLFWNTEEPCLLVRSNWFHGFILNFKLNKFLTIKDRCHKTEIDEERSELFTGYMSNRKIEMITYNKFTHYSTYLHTFQRPQVLHR